MRLEIRLSGSGGQGLILAGIILAEGAILSKLNAIQTQSYGPEARGGASKSEVIISDREINFPKIINTNILLCLTEKSLNEYLKDVGEDGIIIIDNQIDIKEYSSNYNIYQFPILELSKEVSKSFLTANMIALGVISGILKEVDIKHIKESIIRRVPKGTQELNIYAFEKGIEISKGINMKELYY